MPLIDLLDHSINETLARTMMTSLTTLLALVARCSSSAAR